MIDPLPTCTRTTSPDSRSATSSPASVVGPTRSDSPTGQTTDLFGQAVVLVSPSVARGKALSPQIRATFGLPFSSSSRSADLQSSLENRLQAQMDEHGSILFSLTWKDQHTASGRRICALVASGRRTSDSVSIGWPTPTSRRAISAGAAEKENAREKTQEYLPLTAHLTSWPTPIKDDAKTDQRQPREIGYKSVPQTALLVRWPTPIVKDATEQRHSRPPSLFTGANDSLQASWATPNATDYKGAPTTAYQERSGTTKRRETGRTSRASTAWDHVVWLACRDGKSRAVESVVEPLADGLSSQLGCLRLASGDTIIAPLIEAGEHRNGRLRGYGNAICPEVAAEFLTAYLACR